MPGLFSNSSSKPLISLLHRNRGLMFPLVCAGLIFVVLIPLKPWLIDLLLIANLTLAAVILFTSIHVSDPLEFSVFPSLLLGTTLIRLVLNVATTRLILTAGDGGVPPIVATSAAGQVIRSFGQFVASGSLAVGFVIFTILVVIQFVVITKGATRISEVAARFTLDSMPGKQMAVDADLNAGLIDETQASLRRETIARESNFYGAMDGASKFVRGDAIAAIIITLVNIIGGLCVGLLQHGWSLDETLKVFTKLTIGDGLVCQLPAFIIAISAGLIITRSAGRSDLGREMVDQLFGRPGVLVIATIFLALLLMTGLPRLPLIIIGLCLLALAWTLRSSNSAARAAWADSAQVLESAPGSAKLAASFSAALPRIADPESETATQPYLRFELLEIEVGFSLLPLLDSSQPGNLLARIDRIRRDVATNLGLIIPSVFVHDNVRLPARDYLIKVRGREVHRGRIHPGKLFAVAPGFSARRLYGLAATDPLTRMPAFWIPASAQQPARESRYTVLSSDDVLPRQLLHVIHTHAGELLSRQAVHDLLSDLTRQAPDLVADLLGENLRCHSPTPPPVPMSGRISIARIHKVLQNLLAESIPICDLESILEAISDALNSGLKVAEITEHVRRQLAGAITQAFTADDGRLHCLILEPSAERVLQEVLNQFQVPGRALNRSDSNELSVSQGLSKLADSIVRYVRALPAVPEPLLVLVNSPVRSALAPVLAERNIRLPVLARSEILSHADVHVLASFALPEPCQSTPALLTRQTMELFS